MVFLKKMNLHAKYTLVSVLATALDFAIFFSFCQFTNQSGSISTFISASAGGVLSYFLHKNWVFSHSKEATSSRTFRYFAGVLLGILLNASFMSIWCDWLDWPKMSGRIAAASTVWLILLWFNRRVVFKV
jgi:putative flippase GtrA